MSWPGMAPSYAWANRPVPVTYTAPKTVVAVWDAAKGQSSPVAAAGKTYPSEHPVYTYSGTQGRFLLQLSDGSYVATPGRHAPAIGSRWSGGKRKQRTKKAQRKQRRRTMRR